MYCAVSDVRGHLNWILKVEDSEGWLCATGRAEDEPEEDTAALRCPSVVPLDRLSFSDPLFLVPGGPRPPSRSRSLPLDAWGAGGRKSEPSRSAWFEGQ